jgi:phosphoserine phosphatase
MKDFEQREALNQLAGYSRSDWQTSYDAIIPLIQKQPPTAKQEVAVAFMKDGGWSVGDDLISATPAHLCEALLRATRKWTE